MNKDWSGNKKSTFSTLGSNAHSDHDREINDYYATDPKALELLLDKETFSNVWECACGEGHLAKILEEKGILGKATDLIDRGYGTIENFRLSQEKWNGDIITNPPYKYARIFVEKAIELIPEGNKVAMFLKILFLETQVSRRLFEKYPPKVVYVFSKRVLCAINGEFEKFKNKYGQHHGGAVAYSWFVWEKGFKGDPIIKWIN